MILMKLNIYPGSIVIESGIFQLNLLEIINNINYL